MPDPINPTDTQDNDEDHGYRPRPVPDLDAPDIETSIYVRDDGQFLLYKGSVNTIFGPSEAGKSWIALDVSKQVIAQGGRVLYMDFETNYKKIYKRAASFRPKIFNQKNDEDDYLSRLKSQDYFRVMNPDGGLLRAQGQAKYQPAWDALLESLQWDGPDIEATRFPTLIVIDSTNFSMEMEGLDITNNNDNATWFRQIIKTMQSVCPDTCILILDHVPKEHEGPKMPIGGQQKKASVDGAMYYLRTIDKPRRCPPDVQSVTGTAELVCVKDKEGYVRGFASEEDPINPDPIAARISLTSYPDGGITVSIQPCTVVPSYDQNSDLKEQIKDVLGFGMWQSYSWICEGLGRHRNDKKLRDTIKEMVDGHVLKHQKVGKSNEYMVSKLSEETDR